MYDTITQAHFNDAVSIVLMYARMLAGGDIADVTTSVATQAVSECHNHLSFVRAVSVEALVDSIERFLESQQRR